MVITKTPMPILSDQKYSIFEEALKPSVEDQDHQHASSGASVCTPSVSHLPGDQSCKTDLHTSEAVSRKLNFVHLNQTSVCNGSGSLASGL